MMILDYDVDAESCEFYENESDWFLMLDVDEHPHLHISDLKPLSRKLKGCVEDYLNDKKYYSEDTHRNKFSIFKHGRKVGNVYYRTSTGTRSDLNKKEAKLVADKICFLLNNTKHDFEYPQKSVSCESFDIKLNDKTIASFPDKSVGEHYYKKYVICKYGQCIKWNKLYSKEHSTCFTIELDLPEVDMFDFASQLAPIYIDKRGLISYGHGGYRSIICVEDIPEEVLSGLSSYIFKNW